MHAIIRRRLPQTLFSAAPASARPLTLKSATSLAESPNRQLPRGTLSSLWSVIQHRGAKVLGSDVRLGNVIQRKGRIYQVLKAQHTQHGRGGATIQVELRDVDSGNKISERFRTDEAIERVFVEEKSFTYLYTEDDSVMIMEPDTFEQMAVHKDLFGKGIAYLKDSMKVTLQMFDGKPMSASVPQRVTCTVAEAQTNIKGITATPQYKRVLLDNGLTVLAPPFIKTGDMVVINTTDDSYITSCLYTMMRGMLISTRVPNGALHTFAATFPSPKVIILLFGTIEIQGLRSSVHVVLHCKFDECKVIYGSSNTLIRLRKGLCPEHVRIEALISMDLEA